MALQASMLIMQHSATYVLNVTHIILSLAALWSIERMNSCPKDCIKIQRVHPLGGMIALNNFPCSLPFEV